jgi:large subunit ribosomal protein L9
VAKQEVLLVKDVLKLGNMGDMVKVSPGYARNYLFTHVLAIPANAAAKRQVEVLREKAAKFEAEREVKAVALAKSINNTTIQIAGRVAHETELFGAIGTKEIVQALAKTGIVVDTKQVHLVDRIRRLGVYSIEVKLHAKVAVTIKVEVVNSDPNAPSLADTLAALEAARKAKAEAKNAPKGEAAEGEEAPEKAEKSDKKSKGAKAEKADKADKPAKGAKAEASAKPEKNDKKSAKKQKG